MSCCRNTLSRFLLGRHNGEEEAGITSGEGRGPHRAGALAEPPGGWSGAGAAARWTTAAAVPATLAAPSLAVQSQVLSLRAELLPSSLAPQLVPVGTAACTLWPRLLGLASAPAQPQAQATLCQAFAVLGPPQKLGGSGRGHGDPPPTHGQGWAVWPSEPAECSPCPISKQQWTHMCTESPTDSGGPRRQPGPQRKPEELWKSGCPGVPTPRMGWSGLPPVGSLPPSTLMTPTPTGNCGEKSTACWWALANRLACPSAHAARPASTGPCAQLHGDSEGLGPLPGATLATVCLCLCWGAVACL